MANGICRAAATAARRLQILNRSSCAVVSKKVGGFLIQTPQSRKGYTWHALERLVPCSRPAVNRQPVFSPEGLVEQRHSRKYICSLQITFTFGNADTKTNIHRKMKNRFKRSNRHGDWKMNSNNNFVWHVSLNVIDYERLYYGTFEQIMSKRPLRRILTSQFLYE